MQTKMRRLLRLLVGAACIMSYPTSGCGDKDSGSPEDLYYKDVIGRWTGIRKSDEDGAQIVETLILNFWKESERLWYRWTFSATRDGIKDDSRDFVEQGTFAVAAGKITLTPENGEPRTLPYMLLTTEPLYDMQITEEDGTVWKFQYFHRD